ncbi:MAG TPA: choice-of-anchor tandem repeat GloVer-containing protein, partial [Candidatus Acidoferrum sp.]|nr:choice-of-anchor tandem repeat GloVer-containing protein [Candidatus Acidoferrum sp.]
MPLQRTDRYNNRSNHFASEKTISCAVIFAYLLLAISASAQTETALYSFGAQSGDGAQPSGVILDSQGNLYGTNFEGGANHAGAVFKLTSEGAETVLYAFCMQTGCKDGSYPHAGVIRDSKGNLYGTTTQGGAYGGGSVFKLTSGGKETVLYNFCVQTACKDGAEPAASLVMDKEGNLYGTTEFGGTNTCFATSCGTVFKLTPAGKETVLYSFGSHPRDGNNPTLDALILDSKGNLYGTTPYGGANASCYYG